MKSIGNILISIGLALLSAILGWFSLYWVGVLLEPKDDGLGTGLPTVALMYIGALVFAIIGFIVCLIWRLRMKPSSDSASSSIFDDSQDKPQRLKP